MTQRKAPAATRANHLAAEEQRPLRRDAEVNLSRILAAARDVFAEQGYDASMAAIAAVPSAPEARSIRRTVSALTRDRGGRCA